MARLPGAEALGERPTPTLPRRTPLVADYRATTGFEEQSAQVLGHSAAEMERAAGIAIHAQEQQDALRADDAFNKLRAKQIDMTFGQDGFAKIKGGDAVNRPLLKEYGSAFDGAAADLAGTLDNDYQRQLFTKRSQIAGIQMREDLMKHVSHQSDVYADTAFKSGMDTETKMMGLRWTQTDGDALPLLRMKDLIEKHADRQGLQGDVRKAWVDDQTMIARSKGYAAMVQAALASDPVKGPFAAEAIMKLHGDEIDPNARLVLTHTIKQAIQPIETRAVAQDAVKAVLPKVGEALQLGGQPAVDLVTRVISAESAGNAAAVGPETSTGQRSLGLMQLQPATARMMATKLGLPYDEGRLTTDAAYNKQLGTQYLNDMLDRYGGNQTLAVAAYNAGPSRVDEWLVRNGDPRTGAISEADWAAKIPFKETRGYVAKIIGGGGEQQTQKAQTKIDTMAQIGPAIAEGERQWLAKHPGDLVGANLVTQEIKSYFGTIALSEQAEQKRNYATLIGMIMPKVGADGIMTVAGVSQKSGPLPTLNDLMRNPDFATAYNGLDPIQQSGIQTHLRGLQDAALGKPMKEDGDTLEKVAGLIANKTIISKHQLLPYLNHGLGTHYYGFAEKLLDEASSVGGVKINTAIERQRRSADSTLKRSMVGSVMPDAAADASEQYFIALQNKVDEYKNSDPPKDPATLFRTDTPDSMAKREVIMSYLKLTPSEAVARAAKNSVLPAPVDMQKMNDAQADAAFEALPPGAPYIGLDGKAMKKPGVYQAPASAQPAAPPAAPPVPVVAPAAPAPAARSKDEIPAFRSNRGIDPQDQANHLGGLWAAAKEVAGTAIQMAPINLTVQGLRELVGKISSMKETQQEDVARGMWKFLVQSGQFTPDDVPVIEAALKYGNLDPGDIAKANKMLRAAKGTK